MNINALVMKEINTNLVRRTLKQQKEATKHQIAEATGLSIVTISTILQTLIETNEVLDAGFVASSGGRPAQSFRFNANHAYVLTLFAHEKNGLDMLYMRVANLHGECIYQVDTALTDINLHTFEMHIDEILQEYVTIRAIGFGLPGIELSGKVVLADYPALTDTDFLKHYQERYQLPMIVENDVNAASIGYYRRHQIEPQASILYLYFPQRYPPGSGVIIRGELYKGYSNYAGEISGMPLGINWNDQSLYASLERICEAIATLITAISMLLNPYSIILYGPFLTDAHLQDIQHRCSTCMPVHSVPDIVLATDFTLDYQNGMIEQTLALLEQQTSISL